jgi:transketolase
MNARKAFANLMLKLGAKDKKLVVMVGDISHGILKDFSQNYSNRYYNIGICEPSMVNLAAGFSKVGLNPVVHTIAPFLIERSYEQIKLDFAYQKLGVNLVSIGSSFDYSKLGCSHHTYNDVSILSHFNDVNIVIPGSDIEFITLFKKLYKNKKINYFRLSDFSHEVKIKKNLIKIGKGVKIKNGKNLTIAVVGSELKNVIEACALEETKNFSVEIIYYSMLKPFDKLVLQNSVKKTKNLMTVENLSAHDGLYSLAIKALVNYKILRIEQIAVKSFIYEYGSFSYLQSKAGMSVDAIRKKLLKFKIR